MAVHPRIACSSLRSIALGGAVCCALLSGCASQQQKTEAVASIAVANAALTDALGADAERFASGDIRAARSSLNDANAALNDRAYERARLLALKAETDARLARARTNSSKAQIAANELNESTRLLRSELGRSRQ